MTEQDGQKGVSRVAVIGGFLAVMAIAAGIWAFTAKDPSGEAMMVTDKPTDAMAADKAMMDSAKPTDSMMEDKPKDAMAGDAGAMMAKHGAYKDYSQASVTAEQAAGNKVVLFFHAPWCPFCKSADAAFIARTAEIPAGVTVMKTDYDSNPALKTKYGVTYQHTFVQIGNDGAQASKWNGGDIDNLKKYVK
jgi:thiol-disulfide isomerase/thioredoxin